MLRSLTLFSFVLASACAARTPAVVGYAERYGMSLLEAEAIVAEFDQAQVQNETRATLAAEPGEPTSIADAAVILEADDARRFAGAIRFLSHEDSLDARALSAQIEIAWGESQLMTAELLERAASIIRTKERMLETLVAHGRASDADQTLLTSTHTTLERIDRVVHALHRLAQEHYREGKELTTAIIAEAPADPRGYRAAADYYHAVGDWEAFATTIAKVDVAAPHNARVLFLRGMEALDRDGRVAEATELFRRAVEESPGFTRAQAQVVMMQRSLTTARHELDKLAAMQPAHYLVVLAAPWLARAETDAIAMRTRLDGLRRRSTLATKEDFVW